MSLKEHKATASEEKTGAGVSTWGLPLLGLDGEENLAKP